MRPEHSSLARASGMPRGRPTYLLACLIGSLAMLPAVSLGGELEPETQAAQGRKSRGGEKSGSGVLGLNAIIATTLKYHPALKGEREERVAADAEVLSSQGAFDPSIKGEALSFVTGGYTGQYGSTFVEKPLQFYGSRVFAGYRVGGGEFPIYDNYYQETLSGGETQFGFEVPLLRDGPTDKRRTEIGKSESGQRIADALIEQKKIELARAAGLTYWDWTASRNKAQVYKKLLAVAQERDKQISERVKRGDLPDFDRVDNQRAVLQRQAQLLQAERAVRNSEYALALFYRDSRGQPRSVENQKSLDRIPIPPIVPQLSVQSQVEEATAARPEFKNLQAQHEQNSLELKLARNQRMPRLDVRVLSSNDYGTGDPTLEPAEVRAGLRLEIPLATRTQDGKIDYFEAKQRKIGFTQEFLRDRIRADVQDALNALEIAKQRVEVVSSEVKAAKDLARGELKRFELGDSNLIFVNLREQNAADAEVREIEALQDYQKAYVIFEATLARIQRPKEDVVAH